METLKRCSMALVIFLFLGNITLAQSDGSKSENDSLKQISEKQKENLNILIDLLKQFISSNKSISGEDLTVLTKDIFKFLNKSVSDDNSSTEQQPAEVQTKDSNIPDAEQSENENSDDGGIEESIFGLLGDVLKSTIESKIGDQNDDEGEESSESSGTNEEQFPDSQTGNQNSPGNSENGNSTNIYNKSEVDYPPVPQNLDFVRQLMKYPAIARKSNIHGKVSIKLLIGTDGNIIKVSGMKGPKELQGEVVSKIKNLRFVPAYKNSQPVLCWTSVGFSFKKRKFIPLEKVI